MIVYSFFISSIRLLSIIIFFTIKWLMKNSIPPENYVLNENVYVSCRIQNDSCYLYYSINGFYFYMHDIRCTIGLRIAICQLVINNLVKTNELDGFLKLNIDTINTWVNDYKIKGSKSFRTKNKNEILILNEEHIRYLQNIIDKNISIREIEYLQNIDYKLINKAFEENKLRPYKINANPKVLNKNGKIKKRSNPENLTYKTTVKPKIAQKIYL